MKNPNPHIYPNNQAYLEVYDVANKLATYRSLSSLCYVLASSCLCVKKSAATM